MTKNSTKKIPRLRFKGFEGEWEEKKLEELAKFSKGKGYSKNDLSKKGFPIILYGNMYVNYKTNINSIPSTFVKFKKDRSVLSKKGDVIVPASGETSLDIARATSVNLDGIILGSDLNVIHPNNYLYSPFLALNITNGSRHINLSKLAQGNSIVHLHNYDLKYLNLYIPSLLEQQKIGSFFAKLDQLIDLQTKKLEQLKKLKRGYLQKMFPQKGATTPRLRFKEFEGEWGEKHIYDVAEYYNGKTLENKIGHGKIKVINLNSISKDGHLKDSGKRVEMNENIKCLKMNDIVMILSDIAHGSLIGTTAVIDKNNTYTLNQRVALLRVNENIDSFFLHYLINNKQYCLKRLSSGMSQLNLSRNSVENLNILIPSFEEQKHIGKYINLLDCFSKHLNKNLFYLSKLKKSYLQKLFI